MNLLTDRKVVDSTPKYLLLTGNTNQASIFDDDDELFCGMVDQRKAFSIISSRDHRQRSSPSRISDTPRAGFEPGQNLSSGCAE